MADVIALYLRHALTFLHVVGNLFLALLDNLTTLPTHIPHIYHLSITFISLSATFTPLLAALALLSALSSPPRLSHRLQTPTFALPRLAQGTPPLCLSPLASHVRQRQRL